MGMILGLTAAVALAGSGFAAGRALPFVAAWPTTIAFLRTTLVTSGAHDA